MQFKRITFITFDKHVDYAKEIGSIVCCEPKPEDMILVPFPEVNHKDIMTYPVVHPDILVEQIDALCNSDKSYLIFSLSPIVFDTIRLNIAKTGKMEDKSFYYITKDAYKEVIVNRYGACQDWPKGMFETEFDLAWKIIDTSTKARANHQAELMALNKHRLPECKALLDAGAKVAAIKLYRQLTERGLKESKEAVELMADSNVNKYDLKDAINLDDYIPFNEEDRRQTIKERVLTELNSITANIMQETIIQGDPVFKLTASQSMLDNITGCSNCTGSYTLILPNGVRLECDRTTDSTTTTLILLQHLEASKEVVEAMGELKSQ